MQQTIRAYFTIIICLIAVSMAHAQSGENSPFSKFGLGDINDNSFTFLSSMGGIGASFTDPYHINIQNPASYSHLRATAYDFGLEAKYANLSNQESTFKSWSGNLDYMALGFPLRNPLNEVFDRSKKQYWLGMTFALLPYSNVSYNITTNEEDDNIGSIRKNFSGTGGTYKVQWGNSIRYKSLSFGINLGYLFGKLEYNSNVDLFDQPLAAFNRYQTDYSLTGFVWNTGVIYTLQLNKSQTKLKKGIQPKFINIGLHGNSATTFNTDATIYNSNQYYNQTAFAGALSDTIQYEENIKGKGRLPAELGFGMTYYKGSDFSIGFNVVQTFWSSYENDAKPSTLADVQKLSVGGYIRPNYKSFNFRDRVFYRFGVFYNQDSRSILQNNINDYGLNVGFGLPFSYQRKVSHINLGFTGGRRGNDILSETYVKIAIGLTFNDDEWFIKRKYN